MKASSVEIINYNVSLKIFKNHLYIYIYMCVCVCVCVCLPMPPLEQNETKCQFFKQSITGLNSDFSLFYTGCHTKVKEPSLFYHLPIAEGWIVGFMPFPRVLTLCEMQSHPGVELVLPCPLITMISRAPGTPPGEYKLLLVSQHWCAHV